ncbi:hypothetical protein [Rhodococcus sp. USK13]|uniref:hypothetical protein n=1 Tax=Rhodococcus sp. USK13 TaxID=2806442 RepID=UPI001BCE0E23|nr:hypothetical protein [Rhodococcus sp. USK13]
MTKPNSRRNPARHPAVLDLLCNTPTAHAPGARTKAPGRPVAPPPTRPRLPSASGRRPGKKAVAGIAVAALAVAGAVAISHPPGGGSETAATSSATVAVDEKGLPILNLPESEQPEQASTSDGDCRADRGDQKSGAGAIAAFNFAYYSQRSGALARALATPNSSVLPGPELQRVIDAVPLGTSYCVRTIELSHGVYLVDLSLMRPDQPLSRGTQTVTTQEIDGRWYVDVFT